MTLKKPNTPLTPVQSPSDLFSSIRSRLSPPYLPLSSDDSQTKRLENRHWRLWFRKSGIDIKPTTISPITPPYSLEDIPRSSTTQPMQNIVPIKPPDIQISLEHENDKEDGDREDDDETVFDEDNPNAISSHDASIVFTKQIPQKVCRKSLLTILLSQKMPTPLVLVSRSTVPNTQVSSLVSKAKLIQNSNTCLHSSLVRSSEWRSQTNAHPTQMPLLEACEDKSINTTPYDQPWIDSFRCW
ncbi:hypothetical protein J3Q64DRAFT_1718248 [Phycomyces blakesleeanus]|uniref:Nitrogen regulatory protein areA GATA-like domain-containing protein n=1 Tax=Phycomyces blakesleeanus TaxID=4837 RepID=A0ABR3BAU1_PHYBL